MTLTDADKVKLERYRDLLYSNAPQLTVYLGDMETVTSASATTVIVSKTVRKVMSVWLATDTDFVGINYYADPKARNFSGKTITLDRALPAASVSLKVAYYADCGDCEFNEKTQRSRDSNCATCSGAGMVLALGTGIDIPVRRLRQGALAERLGITGEESLGTVGLKTKSEYESMLRGAVQLDFEDRKLVVMEDESGQMRIRRLYNGAGECTAIRVFTQYERIQ